MNVINFPALADYEQANFSHSFFQELMPTFQEFKEAKPAKDHGRFGQKSRGVVPVRQLVFYPLISLHSHVKITACPITTGETLFAGVIIKQRESDMLCRCFERCWFIHSTKLLLYKCMNTSALRFSLHHNLMVLSTTFDVELIGTRVRMTTGKILGQCFTKHLTILQDVSSLLIFCGFCFFELLESRHEILKESVSEVCLLVVNERRKVDDVHISSRQENTPEVQSENRLLDNQCPNVRGQFQSSHAYS